MSDLKKKVEDFLEFQNSKRRRVVLITVSSLISLNFRVCDRIRCFSPAGLQYHWKRIWLDS